MLSAYSHGKSNFWYGVVEDINDPEMLGRIRVRVFGYHSENKQDIKTSDLPWAYVIQDIRSASVSGIGESPTGILRGSHVVGFFRDGSNAQEPIVMGTLGGIPQYKANPEFGHNDPTGQYPLSKKDDHMAIDGLGGSLVKEPDTNRLARNEKIDETVVKKKKDGVDKNVPKANTSPASSGKTNGEWTEEATPYDAKYPKNHVRYSETGHIEEWDDTPGKERLHKYHRTGTFEEIHPDGTRVTKIVGDDYEIMHKDHMLHVKGHCHITVDKDATVYVKGQADVQVGGHANLYCESNVTSQTNGNWNHHINGTCTIVSDGNMHLESKTHILEKAPTIDMNP
jgi:hypothetical protein